MKSHQSSRALLILRRTVNGCGKTYSKVRQPFLGLRYKEVV